MHRMNEAKPMPPPLILYHYPMSPFSQKVRAMLGVAQIPWQSVTVREMPPRPVLETLAGGYRKIPVAQIGADVFCDSKTIATEIARLSGRTQLALERCSKAAQQQAREADLELLLACLVCANTLSMGRKLLKSMALLDIPRFLWDRVNIGRKASLNAGLLRNPRRVVTEHLQRLEAQLQDSDYLFGDAPNHADFSTLHGLWFMRDLGESSITAGFTQVNAWMDRLLAFGDGQRSELGGEAALQIAGRSTPRKIPARHRVDALTGRRVAIRPADYAQDQSEGYLAGTTPTQWILAREAASVGLVHVHFPKSGFELRALEP
jgi:glutathione S-transferase